MVDRDVSLSVSQKPAEVKGKGIEDFPFIKNIRFILVHMTVFLSPGEFTPLQNCDGTSLNSIPRLQQGSQGKLVYL